MLGRFILLGAFLALFVNAFLFNSVGSAGITLFLLLILFVIFFGYNVYSNRILRILTLPVVGLSILSFFRSAFIPQFVLSLGVIAGIGVLWYLAISKQRFFSSLSQFLGAPFHLGFSYLQSVVHTIDEGFSLFEKQKLHRNIHSLHGWIPAVFIGLVAGFPIVVILFVLFRMADPVFDKTITNFFSFFTFNEWAIRIIVSIIVFCSIIPLAFMRLKINHLLSVTKLINTRGVKPVTVVMTMVFLTLGLFMVIQWPYVFAHVSEEQNLTKFGVATYSEYVKKGFIEFLCISSLLYAVLWIGQLALRTASKRSVLFFIQTGLVILFGLFLLSIERRIALYWQFHGLTVIRLYGGLFVLWIGFLTTTLYLRQILSTVFIKIEILVTVILLLGIGILNSEHFIVTHHPPTVNKELDIIYLARLSSDGYEGWKIAFHQAQKTIDQLHNQDALITTDDRRKVAYAGISLGLLNRQYIHLLRLYGSDEAKRNAGELIIRSFSQETAKTASLFVESLDTLRLHGDQATVAAERYMSLDGHSKSYDIMNQIDQLNILASASSALKEKTTYDSILSQLDVRSPSTLGNFTHELCGYFDWNEIQYKYRSISYCVPSFYLLKDSAQQIDKLDRLFQWNFQDYRIYHRMTREMPFTQFHQVLQRYSNVWKKILQQPIDERDYHKDISYDAPFVSNIW